MEYLEEMTDAALGEGVARAVTVLGSDVRELLAPAANYEDSVAIRDNGSDTANYIEATLYELGGYTPGGTHEAQFGHGRYPAANQTQMYEHLFPKGGLYQFVRWNGPIPVVTEDFTFDLPVTNYNGGPGGWTNQTVFRSEYLIVAGDPRIRLYQDGQLRMECTDSTAGKITTARGALMAFWRTGATPSSYCWDAVTVGNS